MTDKYPGIVRGAFPGADTHNAIADEAITIYSPVIYVAPGTGELSSRVEPSAVQGGNATNVPAGIVVDGQNRGFAGASDENSAAAAGEAVVVCTGGRCKLRVNGTSAIVVGDPLTFDTVDGIAEKALAVDYVIARAKQASTGASDFIEVEVTLEGQIET